jgi:hypothetical protein
MTSKYAVAFAVCAFAAMAVWVGYLLYRVDKEVEISWDQGVQQYELTLREVRVLERLLQDGQAGDATVELQRIRQRTLSRLIGVMSNVHAGSARVGALRVFCSEIPVELPVTTSDREEASQRRILATQPLCDREPG